MKQNILSCALIGSLLLVGAGVARADDELGRVSSVAGDATAQRPGEEPRPLACGDPVYADDTLRTGADSRVSVLLDDVAASLDANSRVVLGRTAQSMPAVRLEAGKVRMLDPRDAGAPAQLAVLDASAQLVGNDTEGYIFSEKVGGYAMLCEWDAPLPVTRGNEQKTADPGKCVIAKPHEPLYTANAHDTRIPSLADACEPPALAFSPTDHLSPADVASGPMAGPGIAGLGSTNPTGGADVAYQPCDVGKPCTEPVPLQAIEPPPTSVPGPGVPGP